MISRLFRLISVYILLPHNDGATYTLDTSYNVSVETFLIGAGMWVDPKDSSLFFVGRNTEGGPYQFYQVSTSESNKIINEWKTGNWEEPEDIEIIYENNQTKLWFADQGYGVLSRLDITTGKVDAQIGMENNRGTGIDPIQFTTPGT